MKKLIEIKRKIDASPKPIGQNVYVWSLSKKVAMEAWECHLMGKVFTTSTRYFCREFFDLVRDKSGKIIIHRD